MALKVTKKKNVLWVTGRLFGQQVRRSTRLPVGYEREAEKIRLEWEADIISGRFSKTNLTFTKACDAYLKFKNAEQKLSLDTNGKVERFRSIFGDMKIADMTSGMITEASLDEFKGLKPNSVRRYLNILSAILKHAEKTHGVTVPTVIRPSVDDARDEHFDEAQANGFLDWVRAKHPHYEPHFTILVDCGVRLGEMLNLTKADFGEEYVRVKKQVMFGKTKYRNIPISSYVRTIIPSLHPTGCAVRKIDGSMFKGSSDASTYLGKVLRQGCEELGYPPLRLHDLRHTFAFLVAQAGADIADLQILMGHDDISQTMRYRGFVPSRAKSAIKVIR